MLRHGRCNYNPQHLNEFLVKCNIMCSGKDPPPLKTLRYMAQLLGNTQPIIHVNFNM